MTLPVKSQFWWCIIRILFVPVKSLGLLFFFKQQICKFSKSMKLVKELAARLGGILPAVRGLSEVWVLLSTQPSRGAAVNGADCQRDCRKQWHGKEDVIDV